VQKTWRAWAHDGPRGLLRVDESTDWDIIRLLRRLADEGMTIVVVIHTLADDNGPLLPLLDRAYSENGQDFY
jgi:hypothetical protein